MSISDYPRSPVPYTTVSYAAAGVRLRPTRSKLNYCKRVGCLFYVTLWIWTIILFLYADAMQHRHNSFLPGPDESRPLSSPQHPRGDREFRTVVFELLAEMRVF